MSDMLLFFTVLLVGSLLVDASDSFTLTCAKNVTGRLGSSVVLPCWLSPPVDAEAMEVRWYAPDKFSTPVLLYRNRKTEVESQEESYRNRISLTLRQPQSAGLKGGDVSLKLDNLHMADIGSFHCYVKGDKDYDNDQVTLNLTALGSSPIFSLQLIDDLVNISCTSCGWFPVPQVEWKSNDRDVLPRGLTHMEGREGLVCVHTWVLLSPTDNHQVSCSLSLFEEDKRDGVVDIQALVHLPEHGTGVWKVLFTVALLVSLTMILINVWLLRKYKLGYMLANKDEDAQLAGCSHTNMEDLRKHAVNVTLDTTTAHPDLMVNKTCKVVRDKVKETVRDPGFPYFLSIFGTTSFRSGPVYWEVGLKQGEIPVKSSWLIGVSKLKHYLSCNKEDLTPSKGFWFLYSDGQNGIHVNTEPETFLQVNKPESVGVLLDPKEGELSFYNAKEGIHLITMKTKFPGDIVPMFNPGIGDHSTLRIIEISNPSPQCSNCNETAEGTAAQNDRSNPPTESA